MYNFAKKTWFITGADQGVGYAIAQAVLQQGDHVIATATTIESLLAAYELSPALMPYQLDVTDEAQTALCAQLAMDRFGSIDVLVNCQTVARRGVFEEIPLSEISQEFAVNVFGAMNCCRAVLPIMRQQLKGQIYIVSAGEEALRGQKLSVFSATQYALEGFIQSISEEVRSFGIDAGLVQTRDLAAHIVVDHQVSPGENTVPGYSKLMQLDVRDYPNPLRRQRAQVDIVRQILSLTGTSAANSALLQ